MTTGMIIGRRRCVSFTQRPIRRRITCCSRWASSTPSASACSERLDQLRADRVEDRVVLDEAAGVDVGPLTILDACVLITVMIEMKPSSPRIRRSVEQRLGDVADAARRRRRCSLQSTLPTTLADPLLQVDHRAVLGDDRPLPRHPGGHGQIGVGDQVAHLAVHRHHVARLDDVVAYEQLAGAGVARRRAPWRCPCAPRGRPSLVRPLITR